MNKVLICKLEVQSEELRKSYPYKVYINYAIDLYNRRLVPNVKPPEQNCWEICPGIYYSIDNFDTDVIMMDSQTQNLILHHLTNNLNRNFEPNKSYLSNCPLCNTLLDYTKMAPSMIIGPEIYGLKQNNNYVTVCTNCCNNNVNKQSELFRFRLMHKQIKPFLPTGFTYYFLQ